LEASQPFQGRARTPFLLLFLYIFLSPLGVSSISPDPPRTGSSQRRRSMAAHYFPDEIISDILLRLPVKSLMRFTGVNKAWCSIISSPSFAFAHLACTNRPHDNHSDRLLLLTVSCKAKEESNGRRRYITTVVTACLGKQLTEQDQSIKSFDENIELSFSYKSLKHFEVVGSCNGLVLLKRYIDTLVLWNPLLGKFVTLPKPGNSRYEESRLHSTGWGFGFDSRRNDCKVVKIVCLENNNGSAKVDSLVQVFSLRIGYWTSFRVRVPACRLMHRGSPPVINGHLHRFINFRPQPHQWMAPLACFIPKYWRPCFSPPNFGLVI
jgi:hypothetical protein